MPSSASKKYRGVDYLLGILILLLTGLLLFWTARFLQPGRLPPASPGSFHFITHLDEIATDTAFEFFLEGRPWILVKTFNEIRAVSGNCTLRGSRVSWDPANGVFICERHGCIFSYSGRLIHGLANTSLETLEIRTVQDRIYGARSRI